MFDQLFGRYLVATNCISHEQLNEILKKQNKIRVKMGLIAVSEKFMTSEQAEEINNLQSMMDKRFGDLAIEKGYLTNEQVDRLIELQGNVYLSFIQALLDLDFMTMQGIESALSVYQKVNNFTNDDMEALKFGDINSIISIFTKDVHDERFSELIGIIVRTCARIIDNKMFIEKVYVVEQCDTDCYVEQALKGDFGMTLALLGKDGNLLPIASEFAHEEFEEIDEDVLDAACEFVNCINGMFATSLSEQNIEVDMEPPVYALEEEKQYYGKTIYILPVHIKGCSIPVAIIVQ